MLVYDVSSYVRDHPGGADILLDTAGTDATQAYKDVGHSEDADSILESLCIGTVADTVVMAKPKAAVRLVQKSTPTKRPETSLSKSLATALSACLFGASMIYASIAFLGVHRTATDLLQRPMVGMSTISPLRNKMPGGFLQGFSVSAVLCSAVGGVVATQLSRMTHIESGFTKYPAYIPITTLKSPDVHAQKGVLDPREYKDLPLLVKDEVAPAVFRFVFKLPNSHDVVGIPIGQHVAIKANVDGKAVSRSYTPTSNNLDKGKLELIVRCYADGLLTGKYLANLGRGDKVSFRGPKGAMKYRNGLCKHIGMIAGGTGITPMYQLIRAICEDDKDLTEVSLIYANRTEGDILLREELDRFARNYPKNLKIWYMLDQPPKDWQFGSGYVTADVISERLPKPADDTKLMLCGPPGMIAASKKALQGLGFKAPSAVPKMTDQIFSF